MKLRVTAFLFVLCGLVMATTVIPVSVERLTRESSHVIEATAQRSWSEWNPQHTLIFTYTQFQVSRSLKGQVPATVIVKQMGGSAGGYTQKVAGVRHWRTGEESVLFLRPSPPASGVFEVTGLMQGDFAVRSAGGQKVVSNGVKGVENYSANNVGPNRGNTMPLSELESRVRRAAQQ